MNKRSAITTAAACLFGLALLGCGELPSVSDGSATTDPATQPSNPDPTPSTTGTSLEGKYDYATMGDFANEVVNGFIVPWINDTWPRMAIPDLQYVRHGQQGPEGCTDSSGAHASYSGDSYEYCPPDVTVYVGQDTLWEFYQKTGDAGPAMGLAHEYGHHIQNELGVPGPQTNEQSVQYEDQADCLAGAWTLYAKQHNELEQNDLAQIEELFPLIGSAEGPDQDHGTAQDREQHFMAGFAGGVTSCGIHAG